MKSVALPSISYGRGAALLIAAVTVFRVLYLALWTPLDLSPDEAHYWDWSRHLDWSYYSKGPLVACLIRLSCWLFGDISRAWTGSEMLAVRLPAVLCGTLLLWALYRLTVQVFDNPKWGFAVVGVALTLPVISVGSYLMTIDAPYVCAWAWALVFSQRALFGAAGMRAWLAAGVCIALGVLAKHTMVLFVPMLGMFLLTARLYRSPDGARPANLRLFQPGFWVMAGIGALGGLPILLWNMQNDWVTWKHSQTHAGVGHGGPSIHWAGPLNYLGLQAAILLGYWFIAWAGAIWTYRPGKATRPEMGFLWWMSLPMFLFFAVFSFKNGGGEANWPVAAYLSGLLLLVSWLASFLTAPRLILRRASWALLCMICVLGLALSAAMHDTRALHPFLAPLASAPSDRDPTPMRRFDPTCRLKGWQELSKEIENIRQRLRQEGIEPVLAGGHWTLPGEMGFYAKEPTFVYCVGSGLGDRHSQYDLWRPNPVADSEGFKGRTFILVGIAGNQVRDNFERVEPTRQITFAEEGHPLAIWYVTIAHGFKGSWTRPGGAPTF